MEAIDELSEVREVMNTWLAAFETHDLDALMRVYHAECVYANAQSPLMQGVSEIRPWFATAFEMLDGSMMFQEEGHVITGEIAILYGKYCLKKSKGPAGTDDAGRVALVMKKDPNGAWRIVFDMDNTPPDAAPADSNKSEI